MSSGTAADRDLSRGAFPLFLWSDRGWGKPATDVRQSL